jgi:hypothetical protein
MFMAKHRVTAKGPAPTALALWIAVAILSLGFTAAPALADESNAAEAPLADADGQQRETPAVEEEVANDLDEEPALTFPGRPRTRVLRPDPSDVDDAPSDSGFDREEAPAASGTEGAIACLAGCSSGDAAPPVSGPQSLREAAAEAVTPSASGDLVCVAGC